MLIFFVLCSMAIFGIHNRNAFMGLLYKLTYPPFKIKGEGKIFI